MILMSTLCCMNTYKVLKYFCYAVKILNTETHPTIHLQKTQISLCTYIL